LFNQNLYLDPTTMYQNSTLSDVSSAVLIDPVSFVIETRKELINKNVSLII